LLSQRRHDVKKLTSRKKYLVALVLVAFASVGMSSAFAQSFSGLYGTGNVLPFTYAPFNDSGTSAYAQAPTTKHHPAAHRAKEVAPLRRQRSTPGD
jgi:hypothetical protein